MCCVMWSGRMSPTSWKCTSSSPSSSTSLIWERRCWWVFLAEDIPYCRCFRWAEYTHLYLGVCFITAKKTYAGLWYEIDPIRKFEYFCKILWNQSIIFYYIWALKMVWPKLCLFFSIFARTTSSDWANGACSLDWKPSITSAGLIWRPSWSLCKRRITT